MPLPLDVFGWTVRIKTELEKIEVVYQKGQLDKDECMREIRFVMLRVLRETDKYVDWSMATLREEETR
jgi:hypothetical protein